MTVRGLGLVEHPVPRNLIAIARALNHSKEESPALDLDAYDAAAVVNFQRCLGKRYSLPLSNVTINRSSPSYGDSHGGAAVGAAYCGSLNRD